MGDRYTGEWKFKSETARVPSIVREMFRALDDHLPLSQEERYDLKLIFNELLFNAVIHGNNSEKDKEVHIRMAVGDNVVCASIMDEGVGFNCGGFMEKAKREDTTQKESGRGMKLVMALANEVMYSCNGKQVTFVKRVGNEDG
jgi:serine/threonine-protein kinase RsbW